MSIATPVFLDSQLVAENLYTPGLTPSTLDLLLRVRSMPEIELADGIHSVDKVFVKGNRNRLHIYPCYTEGKSYELREYKEDYTVKAELSALEFFEKYQGEVYVQGRNMPLLLERATEVMGSEACNIKVLQDDALLREWSAYVDLNAAERYLSVSSYGFQKSTLIRMPDWNHFRKWKDVTIKAVGEQVFNALVDARNFLAFRIKVGQVIYSRKYRQNVIVSRDTSVTNTETTLHFYYTKGNNVLEASDVAFNFNF